MLTCCYCFYASATFKRCRMHYVFMSSVRPCVHVSVRPGCCFSGRPISRVHRHFFTKPLSVVHFGRQMDLIRFKVKGWKVKVNMTKNVTNLRGNNVIGLVVKSIGLVTFRLRVRISLRAICKQPWATVCSGQLSLLPFARPEMSSSCSFFRATEWRSGVADRGGGMFVCCTAGPIVR